MFVQIYICQVSTKNNSRKFRILSKPFADFNFATSEFFANITLPTEVVINITLSQSSIIITCFDDVTLRTNILLTLSDTGGGTFWPLYQLYRIKFLNRFSQLSFILPHKIYFYTSWLKLINFLQRVMRYDLFVKERSNISRISDTYKKSYICILLKYRYIPHNNNLLLIPDLFVRPMMMSLWRQIGLKKL